MKLTLKIIKQLIKEELRSSIDESIDDRIIEMLGNIQSWGEENGYWTVQSAMEPWLEMTLGDEDMKKDFEKKAHEMGKTSEQLKQALIDMAPDY